MDALLVVDAQNDFFEQGALAVPQSNEIIPLINTLRKLFDRVIFTKDFHPATHKSFASNHFGKKMYDTILLNGLEQVLWPDHCVQGTQGAEIHPDIVVKTDDLVVVKGTDPEVDSYSGFFDNGRRNRTTLDDVLKQAGINTLYISGLATDYCVKYTALDAVELGYKTYLIADATRAVNLRTGDFARALDEMQSRGVEVLEHKFLKISGG